MRAGSLILQHVIPARTLAKEGIGPEVDPNRDANANRWGAFVNPIFPSVVFVRVNVNTRAHAHRSCAPCGNLVLAFE